MEGLTIQTRSHTRNFVFIVMIFIISRLFLYLAGYLGMNLFPSYTQPPVYETFESAEFTSQQLKLQTELSATTLPTVGNVLKFDTVWYMGISEHGYDKYMMNEPHPAANWVFFPLYPMVVSAVSHLFHDDLLMVGVVLSNLFLLVALCYIFVICRELGVSSESALVAVLMVVIFPTAIFYAVPYTESLFLMLSAMSVYYTLKGNYLAAFLLGGFSSVTRNIGFLNLVFTACIILVDRQFKDFGRKDLKLLGYAILSGIPMITYLVYMSVLTGDFLAPLHEQTVNWYRKATIPFSNYINFIKHPYFIGNGGWDNGFIAFLIVNAVLLVFIGYAIMNGKKLLGNKRELVFFLYGFALLAIPFASAEFLQSMPRYVMVAFPFYVLLVKLFKDWKPVLQVYTFLFFLLNVLYTICYFNGYFFVV